MKQANPRVALTPAPMGAASASRACAGIGPSSNTLRRRKLRIDSRFPAFPRTQKPSRRVRGSPAVHRGDRVAPGARDIRSRGRIVRSDCRTTPHRSRALGRRRARRRAHRRAQGARGAAHPDRLRGRHEHGLDRRRRVRGGHVAAQARGDPAARPIGTRSSATPAARRDRRAAARPTTTRRSSPPSSASGTDRCGCRRA